MVWFSMASRNRNHTYIHDGVLYLHYVLDGEGRHIRMSKLWEKWNYKHPNAKPKVDTIKSFDNGFVNNKIVDLRVAGNEDLFWVSTVGGRKFYIAAENRVLTTQGYRGVKELAIGLPLITMDNYKGYYGDHLALKTDGNSRVRAMLRNHYIPFDELDGGGTLVNGYKIWVVDYDTGIPEGTKAGDDMYTFGLDTYRDGVTKLLGLTNHSTDAIVSIVPARRLYTIGIYMENQQNVVLTNGVVLEATQTEARNDR